MEHKSIDFIAAEIGWGAQLPQTALGPDKLGHALGLHYACIIKPAIPSMPEQNLNYSQRLDQIQDFSQALSNAVSTSIQANHFPIIIGGDHAMAIGTWSGVTSALNARSKFGLIWIDAHMDSHTPKTTPSMAIHGMPLAVLLGQGEKALTEISDDAPKLDPRHVALIGVRSYEAGEAALLKSLGVKVYFIEEVKQRGFSIVLKEAMAQVSVHTQGFGVSLDLDAFDPLIAPGVGSPEQDGIDNINDITDAFKHVHDHPKLKAFEIAEFNPVRDTENKTVELVKLILKHWHTE